jgi:hypothetical protein
MAEGVLKSAVQWLGRKYFRIGKKKSPEAEGSRSSEFPPFLRYA